MKNKSALLGVCAALAGISIQFSPLFAQGTAFTYQGRLNDGVNPATGLYDFTFAVFGGNSGGVAVGGPITNSPVMVSNGVFTANLDFGAGVFSGADRWLEIGVRTNGNGAFTILSPRQQILAVPYAIYASNAAVATTAGSATSATTAGSAGSFSGSLSGDVTGTQSATVVSAVGGMTAANVAGGASAAIAATSANSANTIVKRDSNGSFSANAITASGVVTASSFSGLGTGLAFVPDSALSGNVALRTGGNTLFGDQTISGGNAFIVGANAGAPGANGSLFLGPNSSTRDGALLRTTAGDIGFWRYNGAWNETLRILNSSGNVGIGTAAPTHKLDINGDMALPAGSSGSLYFDGANASGQIWQIFHNASELFGPTNSLVFYNSTAGSSKLVIAPSGNVGIGATAATERLLVNGGNAFITGGNVAGPGASGSLFFGPDYNTRDAALVRTLAGDIGFWRYSGAWIETIRILNGSGNVGIGTAVPTHKLDINGNMALPAGSAGSLYFDGANTSGQVWQIFHNASQGFGPTNSLVFYNGTAGSSKLVIAPSGNVGIGKTNPATTLDVNGAVTATSFSGSGAGLVSVPDVALSTNVALRTGGNTLTGDQTITGGNAFIVGGNAGAPGANGSLFLGPNATTRDGALLRTTAGDIGFWRYNGVWNETLRILNLSGNVGIGTAAPTHKLDVNGNMALPPGSAGSLYFDGANASGQVWQIFHNALEAFGPANSLVFYNSTAGASRLVIAPSGNVGIGSTNATERLLVNGGNVLITGGNVGAPGANGSLFFGPDLNTRDAALLRTTAGDLGFWRYSGAWNETLHILNGSGNVGIGTNNPQTALHVNGTVTASNFVGTFSATQLSGLVSNSQLANSAITVTAGSGLSGGGTMSLGGSVTVANQGVLSVSVSSPLQIVGTQTPSISMADSGVTAGTYSLPNITVDSKGRITAAANAVSIDAGLLGSGTVADARLSTNVPLQSGSANFAGTVTASGFSGNGSGLTNLVVPAAGNYVFSYDTTQQQLASSVGAFQDVTFSNNAQINGWAHTAGSASFTNGQTGLYMIQYEGAVGATASSTLQLSMRLTVNGTELTGSQSACALTSATFGPICTRSCLASLNSGDVLKVQMAGNSTAGILTAGANAFGTTRPTASITITRLQ